MEGLLIGAFIFLVSVIGLMLELMPRKKNPVKTGKVPSMQSFVEEGHVPEPYEPFITSYPPNFHPKGMCISLMALDELNEKIRFANMVSGSEEYYRFLETHDPNYVRR